MSKKKELNQGSFGPSVVDVKQRQASKQVEGRIKQLYEEYKQKAGSEFSREDKLHLLRDVFSIEFGGQFASNEQVFPSFYA
jgi:hypothetical protein